MLRNFRETLKPVYVIAEMACSHEGNPELGRKIIDGAGQAGADAVQFQIWSLPDMVVPHHPDYAKLTRLELSREDWGGLARYSREHYPGMAIIACVYEASSVAFAESLGVDAFKLHSADLSNPSLLDLVIATGKRLDLSVGASTTGEIQAALERIDQHSSSADVWLMYGQQGFPTAASDVHLRYIKTLDRLFGLPVGYQDHSGADTGAAFWLPAAAVGVGVRILEKHITHDRGCKGIDHEAALNPDEFARFVAMVREIEAAEGIIAARPFSPAEVRYRKYSKKSIVAGRGLSAGTVVGPGDLLFMRADDLGLPPDQADRLLGRTLKRDVPFHHLIRPEDVE